MSAHLTRIARLAIGIVLVTAAAVSAQTRTFIKVVKDKSIIWRLTMTTPMTSVDAGTVLEVVGRDGEWYIVRLPERGGFSAADTGRIAATQVEPVDASTVPEKIATRRRSPAAPSGGGAQPPPRTIGLYGFGQVAYNSWRAHDTFAAVLGSSHAPVFGGGGGLRVGNSFAVDGAFDYFQKNGQRVFVDNGEVFKLGIRDTVRLIPIFVTATYRQKSGMLTGYIGGGVGSYSYKETSDFAKAGDDINQRFTGYHGVFGIEFGSFSPVMRMAVEVQVTSVPKALGTSGASAAFSETNLGSTQVRLKILAGR